MSALGQIEGQPRVEWEVAEKHHQGYGVVHGGVHSGVIETLEEQFVAQGVRLLRLDANKTLV